MKGEVVEADIRSQRGSRNANEHAYNVMWGFAAKDGVFLCECRDSCAVEVLLTSSEYVGLRDRGELVYAPGHGGLAGGRASTRPVRTATGG
jgi:hypothetical protein